MPNTTATGGYLLPSGSEPLADDAFEDFLQAVFVGITGMDPKLVRPRWQPEPPNLPAVGTDWMAFGTANSRPDTFAYEEHHPATGGGLGDTTIIRNEEVDLLLTFYGPNTNLLGGRLRDGLAVSQNREVLHSAGVELVMVSGLSATSELVKERWLPRSDMTVTVRREIRRTYPVLNIATAHGTLYTERQVLNFNA